jgi:hypothetical protein
MLVGDGGRCTRTGGEWELSVGEMGVTGEGDAEPCAGKDAGELDGEDAGELDGEDRGAWEAGSTSEPPCITGTG